jgi:oligopeptide/dipeptide ABC transporter ATP-binding protein
MYAGRVVEQAGVVDLFENPRHPYTAGLFQSLPRLPSEVGGHVERLRPIEGSVPDALHFPPGCRFHPRCRYAFQPCSTRTPRLLSPRDESAARPRYSACFYTEQHPDVSYLEAPASVRGGEL